MKKTQSWMMPLLLLVGLTGCESLDKNYRPGGSPPSTQEGAPSKKEIFRLLLVNQDLLLSAYSSCVGVGSEAGDKTIGDYISSLLAQQTEPGGRNWIEVESRPQRENASAAVFWECRVVFHRVAGDERGGWGIRFLIRAKDRTAVRESFECTGGG